jgi:hypothetical protein
MAAKFIYIEYYLRNGDYCSFFMPDGGDYSRAQQKNRMQSEFDISLFLLAEVCRIDSEKKDHTYYASISCDDYLKLCETLATLLTPIQ